MTAIITPRIDIRRAADRAATAMDWLESRHSFSFGRQHDPANTHHGLLLVSNDDIVQPGTGFSTHPHRDMEIVTWVLEGELEHKDSEGNSGLIYPGLAQRMSAGTGILHSEMNATGGAPVHFVQMWVVPDTEQVRPGYQQLDINAELAHGGLVPVASGRGYESAIAIRQEGATLWAGRLAPGERITLPVAPFVHLFVAKGSASLDADGLLGTGDAVRLSDAGGLSLTAGDAGAEILAWEMHGTIRTR
jgi:redox-sensitive bicupin YhaK (pirin superfamily)